MTGGRGGPWGDPRQLKAMFWGPGPGAPWGPGGPGGRGRHRGGRARRGDVRAAMLLLLDEQPQNGYQLIQEIERRTEGVWKPSPGSVYPALQQLEDEGLIRAEVQDGSRQFALTDEGRAHVEAQGDALKDPWRAASDEAGDGIRDLRRLIGQVAAAAMQVGLAGSASQQAEAGRILADTRKALYRILAEDEPDDDEDDLPGDAGPDDDEGPAQV